MFKENFKEFDNRFVIQSKEINQTKALAETKTDEEDFFEFKAKSDRVFTKKDDFINLQKIVHTLATLKELTDMQEDIDNF